MPDDLRVTAVEASKDGLANITFARNTPEREHAWTSSDVILAVLVEALLSRSPVVIQYVEDSDEILRVEPFTVGPQADHWHWGGNGNASVSRIATQRNADTGIDHLEAFLRLDDNDFETAFNIYTPMLRYLVCAGTRNCEGPGNPERLLQVTYDQALVQAIRIGEPPR